ncbi:hypothetical protein ACFT4A_04665 [Streptomyces sp. NPDC057099]|uniref:hypothetical protein n=1 Tax=Streptomyces sp. NPDC057099 TaxID=3346019 RepID=UPI00363BA2E8
MSVGASVRAGMFALVGSVLAALGHHTVAEGTVPWRLVAGFGLVQFAAVRPVARRRLSLPTVAAATLAAQGVLHAGLTLAGGAHATGAGHAGHQGTGGGDGHTWHQVSAGMTAAHVVAALAAGWLLHRADAALTAAFAAVRTVRRVAAAVMARVRQALLPGGGAGGAPPVVPLLGRFDPPSAPRTRTLDHALVRRGPPGRLHVPVVPSSGPRLRRARPHQQGVPACPRTTTPVPYGASPSSARPSSPSPSPRPERPRPMPRSRPTSRRPWPRTSP